MLKRLVILLAFVPFFSAGGAGPISPARGSGGKVGGDCTLKGKKLYGKFKIVDAFPDKCGKWKMVDAFPDVKIQMVTAFPDLKIKYVNAFPGLP